MQRFGGKPILAPLTILYRLFIYIHCKRKHGFHTIGIANKFGHYMPWAYQNQLQ